MLSGVPHRRFVPTIFGGTTPGMESILAMKQSQKIGLAVAITAASITGGAIGASVIGTAGAATTSTPTPSTSTGGASQSTFPAHGSAAHEGAEKAVTGTAATQAQAAAVKSVGSGTAGAVTSDFTGTGYETTVTKADGSQVEVHLDSSFSVMTDGHGGGPDGSGTNG
jgi:hypothetical protein